MKIKNLLIVFIVSFIFGVLLWLSMWGVYRENMHNSDVFTNALKVGSVCGVLNAMMYIIIKKTTGK